MFRFAFGALFAGGGAGGDRVVDHDSAPLRHLAARLRLALRVLSLQRALRAQPHTARCLYLCADSIRSLKPGAYRHLVGPPAQPDAAIWLFARLRFQSQNRCADNGQIRLGFQLDLFR